MTYSEEQINRLAQYFYEEGGTRRIAMTQKPELVAALTRALERLDETALDGGTIAPDEGRRVANAGEFAAAWNGRTREQREDLVVQLLHQQDVTIRCFQGDHEGALEQLARRREEWLVLYWHDDCPECEAHAESAISMAKVTGSIGSTQATATAQGGTQHAAKVRRAA